MSIFQKSSFSNKSVFVKSLGTTIAVVAIGAAALIGIQHLQGSKAFDGHHSKCLQNQAFVNGQVVSTVQTNQTFQAKVRFLNDGTTDWSPSMWGFYMDQGNGDGTNWQPSGINFPSSVPHGTEVGFENITVKAPSSPGNKNFNWYIGIVNHPAVNDTCGGGLNVVSPSPPPTPAPNAPSLSAPSSSSSSIALSWNATSNTTSYSILRSGAQIATTGATSYTNAGLRCGTTYSYNVVANGPGGSAKSNTVSKATGGCTSAPAAGAPTSNPQGSVSTQPLQGSTNDSGADTSAQSDFTADTSNTSSDTSAVSTQKKHSPLWLVLLKIFFFLLLLVGLGFGGLLLTGKYLTARKQKAVYDDYWRKSQGL